MCTPTDKLNLSKHAFILAAVLIAAVAAIGAVVIINGADDSDAASVKDYSATPILWIYGNCDGDYDIDAKDVEVINAVIAAGGSASAYSWCDANQDGVIDEDDVEFVESMIDGTALYLYYLNIDDKVCYFAVRDQVNIVSVNQCNLQTVNLIINKDKNNKVIGSDQQVKKYNNVFNINFADTPDKGALVTGTKNGEVQAEIISTLEDYYGHVEITLGSVSRYGQTLETDFAGDENVSIIRLPSWEGNALEGLMTYGYLFGGVQNNSCWKQALAYYDWYMGYYSVIEKEVAKIPESSRANILTMYVKDCYPGATDTVLNQGSGDYERSILCGGNNIGNFFGTSAGGYQPVTAEDMAACEKQYRTGDRNRGIDFIFVEPSGVYGDGGKDYVINAVQLAIDEFQGYINDNTQIYSISFMVTTAAPVVVSYVFYAKTLFPNNAAFKDFDVDKAFNEYLQLSGWSNRADVSDIVSYGPGHTNSGGGGSSGDNNTVIYIAVAVVVIVAILGLAVFLLRKRGA